MRNVLGFLAFLVGVSLAAGIWAQERPEVRKNVRQLFFDDYLIDSVSELTRTLHRPVKHPDNPVLKREHPWEALRIQVYGTVLYDPAEQLFKIWYLNIAKSSAEKITVMGQRRLGHATLLSYATSRDGLRWNKPPLGIVDFEGSTANNMIGPDFYNPEGFSVLYEPHDPLPERHYKAFYWDHGRGPTVLWKGREIYGEGKDDGIHVAFSSDGIHWKPFAGNPVLKFYSDTGQCVLYDPSLKKYVAFGRFNAGGRKVARTESADFIHWSVPKLVLAPDTRDGPNTQFYGISVDWYNGLYIGVLWMFQIEEGNVGRIDMQLCHSRDGKTWVRDPERRVWLPNGPAGAWDAGDMRAACRSVILPDRMLFYYAGSPAKHGQGGPGRLGMDIGLATLRRDGWVSWDAAQTGTLLTKPFIHPGGELVLNADAAAGSVVAEFLDGEGKPLSEPCVSLPLRENAIASRPVFAESLGATLAGRTVRLKLTLTRAALYALWFE